MWLLVYSYNSYRTLLSFHSRHLLFPWTVETSGCLLTNCRVQDLEPVETGYTTWAHREMPVDIGVRIRKNGQSRLSGVPVVLSEGRPGIALGQGGRLPGNTPRLTQLVQSRHFLSGYFLAYSLKWFTTDDWKLDGAVTTKVCSVSQFRLNGIYNLDK